MYGCSNIKADRLKERIFPLLYHKNTEHFNFNNCNFVVQKGKDTCARVVMWREFNLINSFTLECSFCGPTTGLYKDCHFTTPILRDLGKTFCVTLCDYANDEFKVREAIKELEMLFPITKAEDEQQQQQPKSKPEKSAKGSSEEANFVNPQGQTGQNYYNDETTTNSSQSQ